MDLIGKWKRLKTGDTFIIAASNHGDYYHVIVDEDKGALETIKISQTDDTHTHIEGSEYFGGKDLYLFMINYNKFKLNNSLYKKAK